MVTSTAIKQSSAEGVKDKFLVGPGPSRNNNFLHLPGRRVRMQN